MLHRKTIKEDFLDTQFKEFGIQIPDDISKDELVETFCRYAEDDLYEWLKDNFKSFFEHGNPNWEWIRGMVEHYKNDSL